MKTLFALALMALLGMAATAGAYTNCQTTCQHYGNQTTCQRTCF